MKQHILSRYFSLLGLLARGYIKKRNPYIIGINGSVGKTSCRMIIHQTVCTLVPNLRIVTSPKNFNGELGMSLSIFEIESYTPSIIGILKTLFIGLQKRFFSTKKPYDVIILEYGIDHPGEMAFLLSIAKPHASVHTQIDAVHSLQFGNPNNIAREEFLLEQNTLETVFLNQDDPYLHHLGDILVDTITYSATQKNTNTTISISDLKTLNLFADNKKIVQTATIIFNQKKEISVGISLLGDYHMAYTGIGICLADIISYRFFQKEAIHNQAVINLDLHLQPGRWSVFEGIKDSIIIDSSYNASPRSVKHILQSVVDRQQKTHPTYKHIFVLGEMRELGGETIKEHESLASFVSQLPAIVLVVGESMKNIFVPYLETHGLGHIIGVEYFPHYQALGETLATYLKTHPHDTYIVTFKGSQNTIFLEEAIKYILQNKQDEKYLTRQGSRWEQKKQSWLQSVKS